VRAPCPLDGLTTASGRMNGRKRTRAVIGVAAAALVALVASGVVGVGPSGAATATPIPPPYAGPPVSGPENISFLYQTLHLSAVAGQLESVGHPRDLVYGSTNDAQVAGTAHEAEWAHQRGSHAFKYAQFTWFPTASDTWSGTTALQRAGWALCRTGNTPVTDRAADAGAGPKHSVEWRYADANERGYVTAMLAWTAQLKALGYDGVFIDAAGRALRGPFFNTVSSCTSDPVTPGAPSSTAWFNLLMQIKAQGLQVAAMNINDPSSVDPYTRPDPIHPARVKTDVRQLTWILHENAARPTENYPPVTKPVRLYGTAFDTLATRARNDALNGRYRVVEMAKARLAMNDPNRSRQETYVWSLAKLAGGPVAMNTGWDFCGVPAGTNDCNRTGLSADLTDIQLGTPIDAAPYAPVCAGASCMWVRRFQKGMVVVSAYGTPKRTATIPLGTVGCRHIIAFRGGVQAKGACVASLSVGTATPNFGRIYLYAP